MDKDRLNNMVVELFHGISYEEEKAVITDEFKDISNKDLHIIDAIGIKKPKNMSTIAGDLNITVGTLTTAINNLLKKGYVNRKRGEKDRRVVYISLSEKGRKAYSHHREFHKRMIQGLLDTYTNGVKKASVQQISFLQGRYQRFDFLTVFFKF